MTLSQAKSRIKTLEEEIKLLNEQLSFLEYCPTMAKGFQGERLVSQLVNGCRTVFTASHDMVVRSKGVTIEVKLSTLNVPYEGAATKRWTWARPIGLEQNKDFDRLILVGKVDPRFADAYEDSESPYVFFDVPYQDVRSLMRGRTTAQIIQISTNPFTSRTPAGRRLFDDFQVTQQHLKKIYGF